MSVFFLSTSYVIGILWLICIKIVEKILSILYIITYGNICLCLSLVKPANPTRKGYKF